jgi:Xaa-Pro aminopeptidase
MSEYIAERDERIKFISGFSGSAGICLITHEIAFMWTDGRYWLQAGKELEEGWELKKSRQGNDPSWFEWSKDNLKSGDVIGFDPYLVPQGSVDERRKFLEETKITFEPVEKNLVDEVWGSDQPPHPKTAVMIHAEEFHGRSVAQNVKEIMEKVEEKKGEAVLIPTLDQIAWLTNLRGQDIDYNPLFFSYAVVYKKNDTYITRLYIDDVKTKNVIEYLKDNNIEAFPYEQVFEDLSTGEFKDLKFVLDAND